MTRLEAALAELAAAIREEVSVRNDPPAPERIYSVKEAAAQLALGRTFVYNLIYQGKLRSFEQGRRRLISGGAIAEYLAAAMGQERQ